VCIVKGIAKQSIENLKISSIKTPNKIVAFESFKVSKKSKNKTEKTKAKKAATKPVKKKIKVVFK
jgi:hypothetical protein